MGIRACRAQPVGSPSSAALLHPFPTMLGGPTGSGDLDEETQAHGGVPPRARPHDPNLQRRLVKWPRSATEPALGVMTSAGPDGGEHLRWPSPSTSRLDPDLIVASRRAGRTPARRTLYRCRRSPASVIQSGHGTVVGAARWRAAAPGPSSALTARRAPGSRRRDPVACRGRSAAARPDRRSRPGPSTRAVPVGRPAQSSRRDGRAADRDVALAFSPSRPKLR